MKSKKGAIELSMTTVIVIILGVVLLTLGLAFVRGIFGKVGDLTEKSFGEAESAIGQLGTIEDELTLTTKTINLKQGDSRGIGVIVKNLGQSTDSFQVKTTLPPITAQKAKFTCYIAETESSESSTVSLESGEKRSFHLLVLDKGQTPLDTYVCKVSLYKSGKVTLEDSLIINVE